MHCQYLCGIVIVSILLLDSTPIDGFVWCKMPTILKITLNCVWMGIDCVIYAYSKANLRDLIAATRLVILLKLDSNRWFFHETLKFDGWPQQTIWHIFYTMSSFVHHFKAMGEYKVKLQSGNTKFRSKSVILFPVWPWNFKRPIWVNIDYFLPSVTLKFDRWPEKSCNKQ